MESLRIFVGLFSSRKNQVGAATAISIILAAIGFRDYPPEVIATIIGALATLGGIIINGIKAEDVAKHTAAGLVAAANVAASAPAQATAPVAIDATTVNVTPAPTVGHGAQELS